MRFKLALGMCGLILAACGSTSTSLPPTVGGGGITTLPPTTPSSTTSPSESPSETASAGQINADSMISTIEQQYSQNYGTTITVTCPSRTGSFASVAGDLFQCTFTDANSHTGTLTVSVTSAQGDYNWTIP